MKATVDKFGHYRGYRSAEARLGPRGPAGEGFALNADGNYDMKKKRLTNVGDGKDLDDAVTVRHLTFLIDQTESHRKLLNGLRDNFRENMNDIFNKYTEEVINPKMSGVKDEIISDRIFQLRLRTMLGNYTESDVKPLIGNIFTEKMNESKAELNEVVKNNLDGIIGRYTDENIKPLIKKASDENNKKIDGMKKKLDAVDAIKKDLEKIKDDAKGELKALTDVVRAFVYKVTTPGYARNSEEKEKDLRQKLKEKHSSWREAFPEVEKGEVPASQKKKES